MEDQVAAGLVILDGGIRVRRSDPPSLVRLEDLSGSGPQGPQGADGPLGPPGTVDTSQFYTKAQLDILLAFKTTSYIPPLGWVWSVGQHQ